MSVSLLTRIKSIFARDKNAFWWNHFTDEEKQLRSMDAWQLARIIHEADVHRNNPEKRIVAEHLLNVRLAKIQATASWGTGVLGLCGALIGGAISIALSGAVQRNADIDSAQAHKDEQRQVAEPIQPAARAVTAPPENKPAPPVVVAVPAKKEAENTGGRKDQDKSQNATVKP